MGYTHYYRRPKELPQDKFEAVAKDLKAVIKESGVKICGADGTGKPTITKNKISFNGDANCGHSREDLGITWPGTHAGGVDEEAKASGEWFAGALLSSRRCGGDCSHETVYMERIYRPQSWDKPEKGMYFNFCKTAYKPYDLIVTAFLIICKHYFGDEITISSDGEDRDWFDAKMFCDKVLNYGLGYKLDKTTGDLVEEVV